MNLARWEELARQHIDGIADHVDQDSQIRKGRLARLKDYIDQKVAEIDTAIEDALAELR